MRTYTVQYIHIYIYVDLRIHAYIYIHTCAYDAPSSNFAWLWTITKFNRSTIYNGAGLGVCPEWIGERNKEAYFTAGTVFYHLGTSENLYVPRRFFGKITRKSESFASFVCHPFPVFRFCSESGVQLFERGGRSESLYIHIKHIARPNLPLHGKSTINAIV